MVFALKDLNGGGAERAVLNVLQNWSAAHVAPVVLLSKREGAYVNDVPDEVSVITLDVSLRARDAMVFGRRLRSALADVEVRTIVSTLTAMNRSILRARRFGYVSSRVVVVEQTHFSTRLSQERMRSLRKQELKLLYKGADRIVTCSHGLGDDLAEALSLRRGRIECIHNPIDIAQIQALVGECNTDPLARRFDELDRPVICAAGRLTHQKGFDDLIRAFSRLATPMRGSLVILGEGEQRAQLEELADSLGVAPRVHLPGFSVNPWWYIARSQVFALSSRWEGFGNVLVEAMASGTPVISTDCPHGPAEIVTDHVDGLLVVPGDVAGLCEALTRVLRDDGFAAALSERGRARALEFDATRVSSRYAAL